MPLYYFFQNQTEVPPVTTPSANIPTAFNTFFVSIFVSFSPTRCLAFISPAK